MSEPFDYMSDAARTLSPQFYGDAIPFGLLEMAAVSAVDISESVDALKKWMFYGKRPEVVTAEHLSRWAERETIVTRMSGVDQPCDMVDMLHAAIGMVTEAGELLDAVMGAIHDRKPLDLTNIREEIGDSFWYAAIALRAIGSDFDDAQRVNIAKLRARFPEKFTEEKANNRDLSAERAILEKRAEEAGRIIDGML
jgi:NTP pyrophosphatase (non-canonical NTP hydrolase)